MVFFPALPELANQEMLLPGLFSVIFLFLSFGAFASDATVFITAHRFEVKKNENVSSEEDVDDESISLMPGQSLMGALDSRAGLSTINSGGTGQNSALFIRGGKSEGVLFLVDGMEINDPSLLGRSFNLSSLATGDIERVEIIKGAQSGIHGSDALYGVVNIITSSKRPVHRISVEAGPEGNRSFSGATGFEKTSFRFTWEESDGPSAASGGIEEDGHRKSSAVLHTRMDPGAEDRLSMKLLFNQLENDLDNSGGADGDDSNHTSKERLLLGEVRWDRNKSAKIWRPSLFIQGSSRERTFTNLSDGTNPENQSDTFNSSLLKGGFINNFHTRGSKSSLSVVLERESMESESRGDRTESFSPPSPGSAGFSFDTVRKWKHATINLAARYDANERRENFLTWKTGLLVPMGDLSLKSSVATGAKNPSLYQLYSPFGNDRLLAEKVITAEAGLSWEKKTTRLELTFFRNQSRNEIDYDFIDNRFNNIGKTRQAGMEFSLNHEWGSHKLGLSHTLTRHENLADGSWLLRRPRNETSANWSFGKENWTFNSFAKWKGEREDIDPQTFQRIRLSPYLLLSSSFKWTAGKLDEIIIKADNITNTSYEEVAGFSTLGRNFALAWTRRFP